VKFTFTKQERLSHHSLISSVFSDGHSFFLFPFRVTWLYPEKTLPASIQLLISVPKSNLRLAIDRNLVKRRIREAYRLNKNILQESVSSTRHPMALCLSYTAKEILPFTLIQEKIILILQRLIKENEKVTW